MQFVVVVFVFVVVFYFCLFSFVKKPLLFAFITKIVGDLGFENKSTESDVFSYPQDLDFFVY